MSDKNRKHFYRDAPLRRKLTLSFLTIVILPILLLGTFSFYMTNREMQEKSVFALENNVLQMSTDLEGRLQQVQDVSRFLAYNSDFRRMLEQNMDPVLVSRAMSENWDTTFWYHVVSNQNIHAIRVYSPKLRQSIGNFLFPLSDAADSAWYQVQSRTLTPSWVQEGDDLVLVRPILGTGRNFTTPVAYLYLEIQKDNLLQPVLNHSQPQEGYRLMDAQGVTVAARSARKEQVEKEAAALIAEGAEAGIHGECMLFSRRLPDSGWTIFYYVDKSETAVQLRGILASTLSMTFLCLLISFLLVAYESKRISARVLKLKDLTEKIEAGNYRQNIHDDARDELGALTNSMGKMSRRLDILINQVYRSRLEKRTMELELLQARINPHFLYNCLSTIKWKALENDAENVSDMVGFLARFYRRSLNNGQMLTTVEKEMESVEAYLGIQKITHDDGFDVSLEADEDCLQIKMLNFLLQPIVENAVKHGIDRNESEKRGFIRITAGREGEWLIFRVYNSGTDLDESAVDRPPSESGGYGIRNIRERIELYYGQGSGMKFEVTEDGCTCVTLRIGTRIQSNTPEDREESPSGL